MLNLQNQVLNFINILVFGRYVMSKDNLKEKKSGLHETDMTEGSPSKLILMFALPVFLGFMFQQFYNTIDSLVVGNYVGANALAAIGTCGSINFLFFSLSSGLSVGIGIIVSHYYGAKDEIGVRQTISNSFYVLVIASVFATVIGLIFAHPLLSVMSTPDDIIVDSVTYLRTTCCGILFIAMYNGVANILRALGDSRTPLYFLILSSLTNIVLDLVFVLYFGMGVFGVGFATVLSQALSAIVSLIYAFLKVPYFKFNREELKPNKEIIIRSFKLGVPMALQSSMIAISMMVLQQVVNSFGATVMAVNTISAKVDLIISQFYGALSQSLVTYSGQNLGAQKVDRVKKGFSRGVLLVTAYNIIIIPLIFIFSRQIVDFFVTDSAVIDYGEYALKITSIMYIFLGTIYVPRGILNGCGDAKFSLINGITEVLCRILYANLLTRIPEIGVWGIWIASGLTWFTVSIVCSVRFFMGRWKTMSIAKSATASQ